MKIALVQHEASEDRDANRRRGLIAVEKAAEHGAQIICFAELGFDPFYPQEVATQEKLNLAEEIPGPTTEEFASRAADLGVVLVLNLFERDKDHTYNSSPVIDADGKLLGKTRMVHITDYPFFHEQGYYAPSGLGAPVYETAFGKLGVAICYDRHYPELMRSLLLGGADVVFIPQAGAVGEWPDGMFEAEMQVAAFQNGFFTALCNRVGTEPHLDFAGGSFVCDPGGKVIARAREGVEDILYCDLNLDLIAKSHARRLFIRDRRPEIYHDWLNQPTR